LIRDLHNFTRTSFDGAPLRAIKQQDKITAGTLTTARTEAWLAGIPYDGTHATLLKVHSTAMLALVAGNTPIRSESVPETLLFDVARVSTLYSRFHHIVDGCTVLVTVLHSFGANAVGRLPAFQDFSKRIVALEVS